MLLKYYKKFCKIIKEPAVRYYCMEYLGLFDNLEDQKFLEKKFKILLNYELNIDNPKTFNEKLQWLKLNDRREINITLVDKFKVKKYVESIIGSEYIIPTLGDWKKPELIDFEKLPDKFVLKCNHNSGSGIVICKDKKKLDISKAYKELERGLKEDYYLHNREWPYKNVERRIIAEELLENRNGSEVLDYKFMCFNGKVKCEFVCSNRHTESGLNVTFFDREWNVLPFERHYKKASQIINKPQNLELMIQLAEKLAADHKFIRVDFYEVNNKVYFGELTLFPGSGFEEFNPQEWDLELGSWIEL